MGTRKAYWKANLRLLGILLSIWATVSFGAGILFVDFLNRITILFQAVVPDSSITTSVVAVAFE